jgi:hypothetical protein
VTFPKYSGAGSPEGVQVATVGDYYENLANGDLYNKVTGVGTNTGWVGPIATGSFADLVSADTATAVTCDGNSVTVGWLVAAPPAWADNAGNITEPGVYLCSGTLTINTPPTTPGILVSCIGVTGAGCVTLEAVAFAVGLAFSQVLAFGAADLPFRVRDSVTAQTDITGIVNAQITVQRLAYNVP